MGDARVGNPSSSSGSIRVGVGGWVYEPWRGTFFPNGLPKTQELEHASRRLTAIEINATYYRAQSAASFAKWRDSTPDGFVFSVKATRYATNRRVLAEAGETIERFLGGGIGVLGDKLGPILWQMAPTKRFEPGDLAAFLDLLPERLGDRRLRHAVEARHPSFRDPAWVAMARERGIATVLVDAADQPSFADATADFVYARLMGCRSDIDTGYGSADIDRWTSRVAAWAAGEEPTDLPRLASAVGDGKRSPRDVFVFFISGAKERAPFAALSMLEALGRRRQPSA